MRYARLLFPVLSSAALLMAGCASHPYYAAAPPLPPPPPPGAYREVPPLISLAQQQGYRAGVDNGARDAYNRRGYRPQHDRSFHETPGYDPRLGPYGPYRAAFRDAYLRGYANGFQRS